MEDVVVFIDGPNIGRRRDLALMVERVALGRRLWKVLYYGTEDPERHTDYPDILRGWPLDTRLFDNPKPTDEALRQDMEHISSSQQFNTAILVSGDAGFVPAVEQTKAAGKGVEVASFRNVSQRLRASADHYHDLQSIAYQLKRKA